jgi:sialic acid synthase SpsE
VGHLRAHGCEDIVLLKCTTAYPTPPEEVNLATLANMQAAFRCQVGLSDHTVGIGVSVAAVALGACVIEKHIKLDDGERTVDDFFSLSVAEFRRMIDEIRRAEQAVGEVSYDLTPAALQNRHGRRSLYVSAPIKRGEPFTEANIKSVRPGYGLAPKYKSMVLGRRAGRDLAVGERLAWEVVEGF